MSEPNEWRIQRVLKHEKYAVIHLSLKNSVTRELWQITKKNLQISPSPCRFGRGWASSRCRSAIWSPLLADSCKATHVHVTRTRWCCEDRRTRVVSVENNTYGGSAFALMYGCRRRFCTVRSWPTQKPALCGWMLPSIPSFSKNNFIQKLKKHHF